MLSFDEAMQNLESIVQSLETGTIPLEQLVETYKKGIGYQKICQKHLERAALLLKVIRTDGQTEPLTLKNDA